MFFDRNLADHAMPPFSRDRPGVSGSMMMRTVKPAPA
jgi:hypothetical protein